MRNNSFSVNEKERSNLTIVQKFKLNKWVEEYIGEKSHLIELYPKDLNRAVTYIFDDHSNVVCRRDYSGTFVWNIGMIIDFILERKGSEYLAKLIADYAKFSNGESLTSFLFARIKLML